jgi:hypothetical protein
MRPFGFREADEFWGVATDPELAFRLHALTGGTPEYKDLCDDVGLRSLTDFDDSHFASVARQWCLRQAAEATLGGVARAARPTAIACREHRREHELEAVFVEDPVATGRVIAS